jgi:hypothetical protein
LLVAPCNFLLLVSLQQPTVIKLDPPVFQSKVSRSLKLGQQTKQLKKVNYFANHGDHGDRLLLQQG